MVVIDLNGSIMTAYICMEFKENNKRIAKNTLFLYFRQLLIMAVTLYTSRIVLQTLGITDFGIFNVVGGVVAMFSFVMGTMASASQRYLAFDLANGDEKQLSEIFSIIMLSYVFLAIITLVLSESIAVWFLNTQMNIPAERMYAANWVLQFAILSFLANIFSAPYLSVIIAHEQMDVYAYVSIIDAVLKLFILFLIRIFLFDRLILYSLLMFLCSSFTTICYATFCYKRYRESHFKYFFDKIRFIEMTTFACWNMIGALAHVLRSQGINILLNLFFNPAINAARAIAFQVNGALRHLSTNFYTAIKPQIVKTYAVSNYMQMHNLIFKSTRFAYYLVFIMSMPVSFYADEILSIWLKTPPDQSVLFVQVIIVNVLFETLSMPLVSGLQAANKIKTYQLTVSILNMMNLPISYVFLKMGYPPVTPMYIAIVIVIFSMIPRILICRKYIHISLWQYFFSVIIRLIIVSIIGLLLSFTIYHKCTGNIYWKGIGFLSIIIVCGFVVLLVGITNSERRSIFKFLLDKTRNG